MTKLHRTFTIGDIHGGAKALLQCLVRAGFHWQRDTLIFLGDVCDGWSEVFECIEILIRIPNLISVKGNHDDWFNEFLKKGEHPMNWLHGGIATLQSYSRALDKEYYIDGKRYIHELLPEHIPTRHHEFFRNQKLYHIDWKNRMYCHAGFDKTQYVDYLAIANPSDFYWNRSMWGEALQQSGTTRFQTANEFTEIYIGHTATTNWSTTDTVHEPYKKGSRKMAENPIVTPMVRNGVWNMDTGCGFNGRLTIMDVDTKEMFFSDMCQDLYPNELGR